MLFLVFLLIVVILLFSQVIRKEVAARLMAVNIIRMIMREALLSLDVYLGEVWLDSWVSDYRDRFIPYFAANYPELGITEETVWEGTIVSPNMIGVTYYLFFSEQWEMGLRWFVLPPPYDSVSMYLRRRGKELASTYSFGISSMSAQDEPYFIGVFPAEGIFR